MGIITDPIADLIVRIKNANQRKNKNVEIPYSTIKEKIVQTIKKEGYIQDYEIKTEGIKKTMIVALKYKGPQRVITDLKRISKPGLRVYASYDNIPKVLSGYGIAIISTSKGILTDKEARKANIGGEILAYV
jgi:small subunit ribosomal protein S8